MRPRAALGGNVEPRDSRTGGQGGMIVGAGGRRAATPPPRELGAEALLAALGVPWRPVGELPTAALDAIPGRTRLQVQLLDNRGMRGEAAVRAWLEGDWRGGSPALPGMGAAVARIRAAVGRGERIAVFGDYDADGITSCAVALLALRALGADAHPYIPSREDAGRGPNTGALAELHAEGARLIVTTDNGTTNAEEVAHAASLGMDVIVTDHHDPHGPLAPALAIVNPRLAPAPTPDADLAGAGVAFRLAEALLAGRGDGPDADETVESLLDLVAIGTLADIAPLTGANWALVRAGLRRLNTRPRPGLRALLAQAGLAPGSVREADIGFRLAPRLNAGQRLGRPRLALDLLLAADPREAESLAARLGELNAERQRVTDELLREARRQIDETPGGGPLVVAAGDGWPLGMLGLVAGRLADEFGRPAAALSRNGDLVRGSIRGQDGADLVEALGARAELLRYFGGHARAAGFTVAAGDLDALLAHLRERLAAAAGAGAADGATGVAGELVVDCRLPLGRVNGETYERVRDLAPFGPGYAEPLFVCRRARVVRCFASGPERRHLRLVLRDATAERVATWPGMGAYADALHRHAAALPPLDVVYRLRPFSAHPEAEPVYVAVVGITPSAP